MISLPSQLKNFRIHLSRILWLGISFVAVFPGHGFSPSQTVNLIPICAIQGSGFSSPYAGEVVRVRGTVFADFDETSRRGFFLQAEHCDDDPVSSDGIFVYLGERVNAVDVGDLVEVVGTVQEYYGMTEMVVSAEDVVRISTGNPLPEAAELNPPFNESAATQYFESLEGMHVKLGEARVVGPTDGNDQTWVVRADLGIEHVFQTDPAGTGEIICVDDGGLVEIAPDAKVGDHVSGLEGVLEYSYGVYRLQLTIAPVVDPAGIWDEPGGGQAGDLVTGTLNLENLFDPYDDPATEDTVLSATEYARRLQKRALLIHDGLHEPGLLAVQEVENQAVLQDLVSRAEIDSAYQYIWENGPDRRGLDVALLYRPDQVTVLDYQARQACTSLVDGLGPDGNRDVANPQNAVTCDIDGDGIMDGNRLFSRPPLVLRLLACVSGCQLQGETPRQPVELWVIANHFKSKSEDTATFPYTLARRVEQARFIVSLVGEIWAGDPGANLIVLGDFNDYLDSQPLTLLTASGLNDMLLRVEPTERYTYIYHGVSQVLDHFLIHLASPLSPVAVDPFHVNADFPAIFSGTSDSFFRSSDHDPVIVRFRMLSRSSFLPLMMKAP